jgi:UDP-N-acetylglucosamine transferase subunit ALG13
LGLVCSGGGHFEQLFNLRDLAAAHKHFWLTNRNAQTISLLKNELAHFVVEAHFKKPWTYLLQAPKFLAVFAKERPTHLLCTGSGRIALTPYLLSRVLGLRFIYIDTYSHVKGFTKFGSFLNKLGHPVFYQWESPAKNRAFYIGPILNPEVPQGPRTPQGHVFVTLGTREEPFVRLLKIVEALKRAGTIRSRVIVQAGHTCYVSDALEIFDFCPPAEIDRYIRDADFVITQESAGIGTKCLRAKTPFLVIPRDYAYGELPAESDMREDLHEKLAELGYTFVVHTVEEMREAIHKLGLLKTGYLFDNSLAKAKLRRLLDEG